jgi:hypothetical protein
MEKKIIILLVLILIGIGLSGCGVKNIPTEEPKQEEISQPIISNLEGIAFVLGCMFDPTHCPKKKELAETEDIK